MNRVNENGGCKVIPTTHTTQSHNKNNHNDDAMPHMACFTLGKLKDT